MFVELGSQKVLAQQKQANNQIKIAIKSLEETLNQFDLMQNAKSVPSKSFKDQLLIVEGQFNLYQSALKNVKTSTDFQNTISKVAVICDSVNKINSMLEITTPSIRNEINSYLKGFRKALDSIVILYLGHSEKETTKFIWLGDDRLAPFFFALGNYHNDFKKNYEF